MGPLYITSDITNTCNSRCAICYLTYRKPQAPIFINSQKFKMIVEKLRFYHGSFSLACSYEPFVHTQASSIMLLCEPMKDFNIRINSNGIAMDEAVCDALLRSRVDVVVF